MKKIISFFVLLLCISIAFTFTTVYRDIFDFENNGWATSIQILISLASFLITLLAAIIAWITFRNGKKPRISFSITEISGYFSKEQIKSNYPKYELSVTNNQDETIFYRIKGDKESRIHKSSTMTYSFQKSRAKIEYYDSQSNFKFKAKVNIEKESMSKRLRNFSSNKIEIEKVSGRIALLKFLHTNKKENWGEKNINIYLFKKSNGYSTLRLSGIDNRVDRIMRDFIIMSTHNRVRIILERFLGESLEVENNEQSARWTISQNDFKRLKLSLRVANKTLKEAAINSDFCEKILKDFKKDSEGYTFYEGNENEIWVEKNNELRTVYIGSYGLDRGIITKNRYFKEYGNNLIISDTYIDLLTSFTYKENFGNTIIINDCGKVAYYKTKNTEWIPLQLNEDRHSELTEVIRSARSLDNQDFKKERIKIKLLIDEFLKILAVLFSFRIEN